MATEINLKTQNAKGRDPKLQLNFGYVTTFIKGEKDGVIVVNAFDGQGENYTRREEAEISISQDGTEIFKGTFNELINKLNK